MTTTKSRWDNTPPWEYKYVPPTEEEQQKLLLPPTDKKLKTFVFRSQMLRGLDESSTDECETLLEQVLHENENIRLGVYKNAKVGDNIVVVCSQRATDYIRPFYEQMLGESEQTDAVIKQKRALFTEYKGKIVAIARAADNPSFDGRGMNYSVPICDLKLLPQPIDISFFEKHSNYKHIRNTQITRISHATWEELYATAFR